MFTTKVNYDIRHISAITGASKHMKKFYIERTGLLMASRVARPRLQGV